MGTDRFTFQFMISMFDAYCILSFISRVVSHLNRHLGKSWPSLAESASSQSCEALGKIVPDSGTVSSLVCG